MPYKITYFFEQKPELSGGWTESFYSNKDSIINALQTAQFMRPSLHKIHGYQTRLAFIRVSNVGNFRDAVVVALPQADVANPNTSSEYGSDYPTNALLLRTRPASQFSYEIRQWIKGVPDGVIIPPGKYNPGFLAYQQQLTEFFSKLTDPQNLFAGRVLSKNPAVSPERLVSGVVLATGVVTTAVPHGFNDSDEIRIRKTPNNKYINRIWKLADVTATTFRLIGWDSVEAGLKPADGGIAQKRVYEYIQLAAPTIVRATKKNVGRPFGLLVGKGKRRTT